MIKKFQNPSGKLTYEEALRQAGERVESQTRPSIQIKGVNNSNRRVPNVRERAKGRARIRNREKEEQIQRFNQQNEMHALVPSGKHYDPVADEDVTDYENHYSPKIIGMSGADPLMEFYVGGEALGPLFKLLGKGALYGLGRYYRGTNYGDWAAAKLIAPEMNKALISNSQKLIPSLSQYISLTQQPIKQNESGLTSLKFLERPSKITKVERLGIPKGERNFRSKWHVANYPGYQLKGLMKGSPLEKQLSKQGTININQLNAYFNKASQIERDVANKVLAEKFTGQKTIDYNQFKKAVQDELITYNVSPSQKYSSYGINRLGFDSPDTDLGIQRILLQKYPERFSLIKNGQDVIDRTLGTEYFVDRQYGRGWHSNSRFPQEIRDEYVSLISNSGEQYPKISVNLFSSPRIPKGNATHYDINTLGHSRTMVVPGDPKTLYILESQSDWAQKSLGLTKAEKAALQHIDEQLKTGTPNGFSTLEELQIQKQAILDRASQRTQGISYQSQHLHDNYLQRQLQENLRYAAENGQTKMRYPTSETAAKIEGYQSKTAWFTPEGKELNPSTSVQYNLETGNFEAPVGTIIKQVYAPEHQTILKKYADFPKLFQKLYKGQNVRIITDAKGNTWYEVDVPKGYLNREWQFKQGGKMNTIQFLQRGNKIRKGEDGFKNLLGNSTVNSPETRNISDHNLGRLYDELSKSKIPMNHTTREQFITRSKDVINAINKHFSGPEIPRVFRNALLTVALEETGLNPSNQYLYGIIGGLRNLYQQKFGGRKDSDSITHFIKNYFKGEYKNLGYSPKAIPSNITDPREILTYYMTNLGDPSFFKRKNKGNTIAWKKWNEWLPIILNSNLIAQNDSNFENKNYQFNTFNNESENNLNNVFNNSSENDSYNIVDPANQLEKLNKQSGNIMLSKNGSKFYKQGSKITIYKFKKGNKIHIKKANRGKFTDYCGGKVTNECIQRGKNSSNPAIRKRATFAANARKWNHKKGGIIVAGDGIKLGNIFSKAQSFLNSDLGKNVVSGITSLYSGIKQSNNQRKQEEQLLKDYNYISKQINTQDVINKTNQQFQELQQQDPNIHVSEIDWRNLYGKNEGIAKQQAQANARNYLVNARQQMMLQNSQSSGGGLDFSGLINAGAQLLAGNKNKTNTTTTNTQIPSTATPTYFSSGFDWSKPTLASAIKFST